MNGRNSIAIVGGGPAGCLAGALLATAGNDVHIFDEKLAWEKPCGGGITFKALQQYPFLAEARAESKSIEHCELISPSGKRVRFRMQHPVAIFSRLALNGSLLDRARSAGATVHGERVPKIEGSAGAWRLIAPRGEHRASYLILAAGARNPFRGQFTAPILPDDLMATAGYYIPVHSSLMQIQFLEAIRGYIWVFPRLDHVSAGIAGKMGEVSTRALRRELEQWLEQNGFSLDGATFYSHILPSLRAQTMERIETSGNGWAMVGDSAGLVEPDHRRRPLLRAALGGIMRASAAGQSPRRLQASTRRRSASRAEARGTRFRAFLSWPGFRRKRHRTNGRLDFAKRHFPRSDERLIRRHSGVSQPESASLSHLASSNGGRLGQHSLPPVAAGMTASPPAE